MVHSENIPWMPCVSQAATITHRADEQGIHVEVPFAPGMCVEHHDLGGGPPADGYAQSGHWITFNREIFNYVELTCQAD